MANRLLLAALACLLLNCGGDPKLNQYLATGESLYVKNCSNCHQKDGSGLGLVYPPLAGSDYMEEHLEDVICQIRYGKSGSIVVAGKEYNKAMPGVPLLTDLEVAEITTYIYNQWGHHRGLVDVKVVSERLKQCER